jgi:thiamine kinase-like enzyme
VSTGLRPDDAAVVPPTPELALDIARRVPGFELVDATNITPLSGGITNRNYRLTLHGESVVVRLNGKDTHLLGIDRRCEVAAAGAASQLGIAPSVIALLAPEEYLVTQWIDGRSPASIAVDGWPRRLGAMIATFHHDVELPGSFDCFSIHRTYAATAASFGVAPPADYERAAVVADRIAAVFDARGEAPVATHNDLLPGNVLVDADDHLWLIDWEYAGMGNRWFDLGNLATNNGYGADAVDELLAGYLGRAPLPDETACVELMCIMSDLREAMWGVVQQAISALPIDYAGYAARHLDRMLTRAATPAAQAALALAAGTGAQS